MKTTGTCSGCLGEKVEEYVDYSSNKSVTVQRTKGDPRERCSVCDIEPAEFVITYPA